MKVLGNLLLVVSLSVGALAAATAYLVPLDLPDEELEHLTLSAPAGAVTNAKGETVPLLTKGQSLTAAAIARLRSNEVRYVRVNDFALERWPGRWVFGGAVVGLLAGAGLIRSASRRHIAAASTGHHAELPEKALLAIQATVEELRGRVVEMPGEQARLRLILEQLSEVQKTHMAAFVEARPLLLARLGLGGFAALMDRYAAAERQINRAWSAAADGVQEEAVSCLGLASACLEEAVGRLPGAR